MNTQIPETKFYATFKDVLTEIAIFDSKAERDSWVNFQDELSILTDTTIENCTFERIALSSSEAEWIAGCLLDLPELFVMDAIIPGLRWLSVL